MAVPEQSQMSQYHKQALSFPEVRIKVDVKQNRVGGWSDQKLGGKEKVLKSTICNSVGLID